MEYGFIDKIMEQTINLIFVAAPVKCNLPLDLFAGASDRCGQVSSHPRGRDEEAGQAGERVLTSSDGG